MPLTIQYKDRRNTHEITIDGVPAEQITRIIKTYMLYPSDFDNMLIDLSDDNCEQVICAQGPRCICYFGGAQAWNIYRQTAEVWPEINYHLAGRPAGIP